MVLVRARWAGEGPGGLHGSLGSCGPHPVLGQVGVGVGGKLREPFFLW